MTNESENAYPLDESIWEHVEHMDYRIGIPISPTRSLNILKILEDIYDESVASPKAREMLLSIAAILIAAKSGNSDMIWEEIAVKESMKDFDKHIKEILDEESE